MLVESWLLRAARRRPRHPALVGVTYAELLSRVDDLAARLFSAGVGPGTEVGLALDPGAPFVEVLHALLRLGAVAVPVAPGLPVAERDRRLSGAVATIDERGGEVTVGGDPLTALRSAPGVRHREVHDLDAPAIVVHTSGTSGPAKPVVLTYGNWLWSALGSAATLGCPPDERWLCAMPLHHVGGLSILVRSAIAATTAVVHEGWDTERVLAALRSPTGPTVVSLVPTTLRRLLDAGLRDPPTLRWALLGGAAVPGGMLEEAAAAGIPVAPTYGMSEASSQIATLGHPLFCTRVELAVDGEVLVAGPTVCSAGVGPDGWLRTGDLGTWDAGGRLRITGRSSDTIITGGENVLPLEVERVLEEDPAVSEAAVFGRPDPVWGERVCARVVAAPGESVDPERVRAAAAARLAPHQRPKQVEVVDALPRTPSGKLLRREL